MAHGAMAATDRQALTSRQGGFLTLWLFPDLFVILKTVCE
jgi:hypothetical protein